MSESLSPATPATPATPSTPDTPVTLDEARAWLRMGNRQDDAILTGLLRAASDLCEAYIGQYVMTRTLEEDLTPVAGKIRLTKASVQRVEAVKYLTHGNAPKPLASDEWSAILDNNGLAEIRLSQGLSQISLSQDSPQNSPHANHAGRYRVRYVAGMAENPSQVPETLRQGILRMIAYLHGARDSETNNPPTVVALLWQPWRRIRLGQ